MRSSTALLAPPAVPYVEIKLRTGLRLEQVTALLQTIDGLKMDPREFYDLASHPTPELLADYEWLELPDGASLQGYLWPATYRVLPDTTGEELVRLMLDRFQGAIEGRMNVPGRARDVVPRGAVTRVARRAGGDPRRGASADRRRLPEPARREARATGCSRRTRPSSTRYDTVKLAEREFESWREYVFWDVPKDIGMADITLPEDLQGYQTYQTEGLIPGPICTPTLASIDAALAPDTAEGYVFFLAKNDGSDGHAFARNQAEHDANREKYGY